MASTKLLRDSYPKSNYSVAIVDDEKDILNHLTGMSSSRWGNGIAGFDENWFKLYHSSPHHKGDKSPVGFAETEKVKSVILNNKDKVHKFYLTYFTDLFHQAKSK
jgi:hypothetical protein